MKFYKSAQGALLTAFKNSQFLTQNALTTDFINKQFVAMGALAVGEDQKAVTASSNLSLI